MSNLILKFKKWLKSFNRKKAETKTPIMFDGHETKMYIENCDNHNKLAIALIDYLGDDFVDLLINRYDTKITKELSDAINDRKNRNIK